MVISENGIFLFMGIFWDLWEKWYLFYGFGIIFDGRCLWCSNVYSIECRICGY